LIKTSFSVIVVLLLDAPSILAGFLLNKKEKITNYKYRIPDDST
jgi:hypothetical protein